MKKGYAEVPDGQIHYRFAGTGENLIMLHQTPTSSDEYSRLIPILAEQFNVVAMDTPGYGHSYVPSSEMGIPDYAQNVLHLMDVMGIEKTHLFGHHTGAIIAVELATSHPEKVNKLVLSGCPGWDEKTRMEHLNHRAYQHVVLDEEGEFLTRKWAVYKSFCAEGAKPEVWYPGFCASVDCGTRVHDGHVAAFKYDILSRFPLITQPTLLLSGERDQFVDELETTGKLIKNCKTGVVKGGGTLVALEAPENMAEAILNFI
jgi:pimeloyl-ACP methyl ester carboxylesterase